MKELNIIVYSKLTTMGINLFTTITNTYDINPTDLHSLAVQRVKGCLTDK
jgi:hypothetical protein